VTLNEFEQDVFAVALASRVCGIPIVRRLTASSITLRLDVSTGGFVDAFYNEQTGTLGFALVRDARRVFGADYWRYPSALCGASDPGSSPAALNTSS
jgi:hypothetical protein